MRTVLRALLTLVLASALVPLVARTASADGATTTFMTVNSDVGDPVGGGRDYLFRGPDDVTLGRYGIAPDVTATHGEDRFTAWFLAPEGQELTAGTTYDAVNTPDRSTYEAVMNIGGIYGCNALSGRFTVLDWSRDENRLWVVYQQHCEGVVPAVFGEIKINEPTDDGELLVAPERLTWPDQYPGLAARTVPVTVVNTGAAPVAVDQAAIEGGDSSFSVEANHCTTLAPGGSCTVDVGFTPDSVGLHTGTLALSDSTTPGRHVVVLSGRGAPGHTSWDTRGASGDSVAPGTRHWDPSDAHITATGDTHQVSMVVDHGTGTFSARFAVDDHHVLRRGDTYLVPYRRQPPADPLPAMSIGSPGNYCRNVSGAFKVRDVAYAHGKLTRLAVLFEQHCDALPPLFGSLAWHSEKVAEPVPTQYFDGAARVVVHPDQRLVVAGASSTLRGNLEVETEKSLGGRTIVLERRYSLDGAWTRVGVTTTHTSGWFSRPITPARNTYYRAIFRGAPLMLPAASDGILLRVAPHVVVTPRTRTVALSRAAHLDVAVTPRFSARSVQLQTLRDGRWTYVTERPLYDGHASFAVREGARGDQQYRVIVPQRTGFAHGVSEPAVVHVR